jgi:hypothetical protein
MEGSLRESRHIDHLFVERNKLVARQRTETNPVERKFLKNKIIKLDDQIFRLVEIEKFLGVPGVNSTQIALQN